jgi:2-polyprenyl-6-methoxyphenol hydroxylase-like FAD-dependent oxidoreductase
VLAKTKSNSEGSHETLFSHEYTRHFINPLSKQVLVEVADRKDGGVKEIECEYLVGADGVRSRVRADLGIEMTG